MDARSRDTGQLGFAELDPVADGQGEHHPHEGLRHDRIMEQVLAMPGIEEKWESEEVEKSALELMGAAR